LSLKKSAITGIKWSLFTSILVVVLSFIELTILAKILTPKDFGVIATASVINGLFMGYIDLGISAAVVQRDDISREQLSTVFWLYVLGGLFCYLFIVAITPLAASFFNEPQLGTILPAVALSTLLMSFCLQPYWLLEKNLHFDLLAKQEVSFIVVGFIVTVWTAYSGKGVWALVYGPLAGTAVRSAMILWSGFRRWPPMLYFNLKDLDSFKKFGLFQLGERTILYSNNKLDQLLVGKLLGVKELGYYNFASTQVIQLIYLINPILTRVSFPVLARLQNEPMRLKQNYLKIIGMISWLNAPITFGLVLIAPSAVPLVFGPQWTPAVPLVQLLAINSLIRCTGDTVNSLLLAKGRVDASFNWNIFIFITTLPASYVGASTGGVTGIAIAQVLMGACLAPLIYCYLAKPLIGPCGRQYFAAILKPFGMSVIMAVIVWIMFPAITMSVTLLILETLVGGALYLTMVKIADQELYQEIKGLLADMAG